MPEPLPTGDSPQAPKILKASLEILATLRPLQTNHVPLTLRFPKHSSRYQSYIIEINTDYGLLAFDEIIPIDGDLHIKRDPAFKVEGFHDGVRIAWENTYPVQQGELNNIPCHWVAIPDELIYHQRRSAYRASLLGRKVPAALSDAKRALELLGELMDISTTGCKLRVYGNLQDWLEPGVVYRNLLINMPSFREIQLPVELRYTNYDSSQNRTFLGFKFHDMDGLLQRDLARYITQIQREFRRNVL